MIVVEHLTRSYGDHLAVDDLSFTVASGEIVGLVGPNGAGKTTTMRMIAGILPPGGGSVHVDGHDVVRDPVAAKRRLAIVPDEPHLFNALTVWEHLDFTARVYGVAEWHAAAVSLLEELELIERRDSLADELSRGMRQKVALACALLYEPRVLLLDEPLTGLDPRGIRTLYSALRSRAAAGTAVVLSSHLLGQIEGLCTGLLIVRRGRLLVSGTKEAIRARFPELGPHVTLEEIFFHVTEGGGEKAADARAQGVGGAIADAAAAGAADGGRTEGAPR